MSAVSLSVVEILAPMNILNIRIHSDALEQI